MTRHINLLRQACILKEMASLGCTRAVAARHIGRRTTSLNYIMRMYGVRFPITRGKGTRTPTRSPVRLLIAERYAQGVPPAAIAAEIDRTPKYVMVVASQMGVTGGSRLDPAKHRRGFEVPDDKFDEYLRLGLKAKLPATERARMLGIDITKKAA